MRIQRDLNTPVTVLKRPVNFILAYITCALIHYPNAVVLKDKMVAIKEWIYLKIIQKHVRNIYQT